MANYPVALTIAGSDSGGGAGIQADLRTFAFHRVHGASVITCLTAQNTLGVTRVVAVDKEMIKAQIDAVADDLNIQGIKLGMLLNREIMLTVANCLEERRFPHLVVDPVMVSRTGAQLIDADAVNTMIQEVIPLASLVTPNLYEAQILAEMNIENFLDMQKATEKIFNLGAKTVLLKGGAMSGDFQGVDLWFDGEEWYTLKTEKVVTKHNHGTGCTLSAAIAANLALGKSLFISVAQAKEYVTNALKNSLAIGSGTGPVGHFFPILNIENDKY